MNMKKPSSYLVSIKNLSIKVLKNYKHGEINIPMDFDGQLALWIQVAVENRQRKLCIYDCKADSKLEKLFGNSDNYQISHMKFFSKEKAIFVKNFKQVNF